MTTVLESLNAALHRLYADDERVVLIGEDVLDPYGGAFKVTRGLSTAYPDRVLTTPVSEAGIVGVGAGMALRGLRPVVEIMFGDFLTLAADQLINHAAKFRWMYNEQVSLPLVIRTPMGGRRGYGPTHSQTLEKLFMGVPGLRLLAPTALGDPGELLYSAVCTTDAPILFIENKLLYNQPLHDEDLDFVIEPSSPIPYSPEGMGAKGVGENHSPAYCLSLRDAPPSVLTLTAYGYMAELALQAARRLAYEHEVFTELLVFTELSPFTLGDLTLRAKLDHPLTSSLQRTGRLLTIEEGTYTLGWGAEVVARSAEALGPQLKAARRLAARDLPVPASGPLEAVVLPGVDEIVRAGVEMVKGNRDA
jgi:pyruvate/2-oxoglutarate/acetoin dehydrogenase E1 component